MNEKLTQAMDYISDAYIAEAAAVKKKRSKLWMGALAAILALALLLNGPVLTPTAQANMICRASEARYAAPPDPSDYESGEEYQAAMDAWMVKLEQTQAVAAAARTDLTPFFRETTRRYLEGSGGENRVWSPVNAYIALAMLAEITDGESRRQILEVLNTADLETLRSQAGAVWEDVYDNDGQDICVLANSLWMNKDLKFHRQTMDNVAYYHYASVFQADFASEEADKALRDWLNENTGNLLEDYTASADLSPEMVLDLVSTVYFQAKWGQEFDAASNTEGLFHAPGGDISCIFMNRKNMQTYYYRGQNYGAVNLSLKNSTRMWLILPDEGKTPEDVLATGEYLERIIREERNTEENTGLFNVNLSLPKFDISSGMDAKDIFRAMGITDVFDGGKSDFSAITSGTPLYISAVNQAARVTVDEQGVKAASYIEMPTRGVGMPLEQTVDFILDRPFLFVIADNEGTPLFVGLVNNP